MCVCVYVIVSHDTNIFFLSNHIVFTLSVTLAVLRHHTRVDAVALQGCAAVYNMARNHENKQRLVAAGAQAVLQDILALIDSSAEAKTEATDALRKLA